MHKRCIGSSDLYKNAVSNLSFSSSWFELAAKNLAVAFASCLKFHKKFDSSTFFQLQVSAKVKLFLNQIALEKVILVFIN